MCLSVFHCDSVLAGWVLDVDSVQVRRGGQDPRSVLPHLETRHRPLQQVRSAFVQQTLPLRKACWYIRHSCWNTLTLGTRTKGWGFALFRELFNGCAQRCLEVVSFFKKCAFTIAHEIVRIWSRVNEHENVWNKHNSFQKNRWNNLPGTKQKLRLKAMSVKKFHQGSVGMVLIPALRTENHRYKIQGCRTV